MVELRAFKTAHGYGWEPPWAARSGWFSTGLKMLVRHQHFSRPECATVWARTNLSSLGRDFGYSSVVSYHRRRAAPKAPVPHVHTRVAIFIEHPTIL